MEVQIGQLTNMVSNKPQGALPNNTEKNPKKQVHAITLRNGKELQDLEEKMESKHTIPPKVNDLQREVSNSKPYISSPLYIPPHPFPL